MSVLCSTWHPMVYNGFPTITMKLNHEKVMRYYYTEYGQREVYLTMCFGLMTAPNTKFFTCFNSTKEAIDKYATYQTFDYIMENLKEAFISDLVIMPLIFILGIFGKYR